jgi:hypothetical protein
LADNTQPGNVGSSQSFADPLLQISFSTPQEKQDKETGRKLLSRIYKDQNVSDSSFFFKGRAERFRELIKYAMGRNNIQEFLDLMKIDGNNAVTGIDPTPNRSGPQFVETLVNSMSQNEEYPCVTAVDDGSISEKEQRKIDALHRMHNGENIAQMQDAAGMLLEPPNAYIPEDELSAEVYFKLEDRLPIEIELEEWLSKCLIDNEFPTLKRRFIRDGIVLNVLCNKIEKMDNGFVGIRKCIPSNLIYSFFQSDSGKMELTYIGEVYSLKVRDLRKKYGKSQTNLTGLDEKDIFEICKTSNQTNVSNRFFYSWLDSYMYNGNRPYDDFAVQVFDCEIKVFDTDYYVSKTTKYGSEDIQFKKDIPNPTSDKAKVGVTNKYTVYRGIWSINADKMIYWGLPDVVIKPYMDISESLFSYSIQIPNNDGDYVPSLFERAMAPLKKIALCDYRLRQYLAAMAPPGVTIDTESARDVEFNGKILKWEDLISIRSQTGVVLWSSRGLNPAEPNQRPPIEGIANAESVAQLTELNNQRNEAIQEVRQVLGVPLYRDGSDLPPRMGAAVVENQTANSNNVTDFIVHAFHSLMQETLHKICILKWDDIVLKQGRMDLIDTRLQVEVEMKATQYENQLIENNIAIWSKAIDGNGNPLLTPKDVFKIRQIKNFKLQDLYLSNIVEQNRKRAEKQRLQDQQANIQSQQQSAQLAAQAANENEQMKQQFEASKSDAENKAKKEQLLLSGIFDLLKVGAVPPMMMPLVQAAMENVALPIAVENQQMRQAVQQQMMQAAQGQQQGVPPDQTQQPTEPQHEQQEAA